MEKVWVNCGDCGVGREVAVAIRSLTKRCKPCQAINNRKKARDNYRKRNGIPLDAPVKQSKNQKKQQKAEDAYRVHLFIRDTRKRAPKPEPSQQIPEEKTAAALVVEEKAAAAATLVAEEKAKAILAAAAKAKAIATMLDMLDDTSTVDDWLYVPPKVDDYS